MKALKPLTMILLGGFLMFAGYSYFTSPAYFIPLTQAKKKQVLNQASPYLEELIIESKSSGTLCICAFAIPAARTRIVMPFGE